MVIHLRRGIRRLLLAVLLAAVVIAGFFGIRAASDLYYRYCYPCRYETFVTRSAAENGIDPYLLFALIKTESDFQPDATSAVGARGLCQIMEDTYDWIRWKLDDTQTSYDDMYDPETGIRYGAYLLGSLYQEFGSCEVALAAYHAGRGAVNEWLSDTQYSPDGRTLDRIPIDDTAHYVSKVMRAYEIYQKLYAQPD